MEAKEEWKSKLLDKRVSCKQNGSTGKTVATYFCRQPLTTLEHSSFSLKMLPSRCWFGMINVVPAPVEELSC